MKPTLAAITVICAAVTLAVLVSLAAMPAHSQIVSCGPVGAVAEGLLRNYGETRQAIGHAQSAGLVIYANPVTGTWTIVIVTGGQACLAASGGGWEAIKPNV